MSQEEIKQFSNLLSELNAHLVKVNNIVFEMNNIMNKLNNNKLNSMENDFMEQMNDLLKRINGMNYNAKLKASKKPELEVPFLNEMKEIEGEFFKVKNDVLSIVEKSLAALLKVSRSARDFCDMGIEFWKRYTNTAYFQISALPLSPFSSIQ